jgi:hypothetical protein
MTTVRTRSSRKALIAAAVLLQAVFAAVPAKAAVIESICNNWFFRIETSVQGSVFGPLLRVKKVRGQALFLIGRPQSTITAAPEFFNRESRRWERVDGRGWMRGAFSPMSSVTFVDDDPSTPMLLPGLFPKRLHITMVSRLPMGDRRDCYIHLP